MRNIEILSIKVKKATEKLKKLQNENLKLKTEVEFLRKENEKNRKKMGEYTILRESADNAIVKMERIIKKIDTMKVS